MCSICELKKTINVPCYFLDMYSSWFFVFASANGIFRLLKKRNENLISSYLTTNHQITCMIFDVTFYRQSEHNHVALPFEQTVILLLLIRDWNKCRQKCETSRCKWSLVIIMTAEAT